MQGICLKSILTFDSMVIMNELLEIGCEMLCAYKVK
jgi:hypothetical protein